MTKTFEIIKQTRINFTKLIDGLTIEQLNKIPTGFNNNIAWHYGHIIASQQNICYKRAGIPFTIDKTIVEKYQNGTRPESFITEDEINNLKQITLTSIDKLMDDFEKGVLNNYPVFQTMYGVKLESIHDGIKYLCNHDSLHYGYAQAMKKVLLLSK